MFNLYGLVNHTIRSKNTILINDFDLNNIIASWEMQWNRPPTEKELQNLINLNVKQEIFYQEALKMNLDHNDEIIKRRLSQKMQFLSDDIASLHEPTEKELKQYYEDHADKYLTPYVYSLYQITFSPDSRSNNKNDVIEVLEQSAGATFEEMKDKGDPLPFSYYYPDINADELALLLGSKFPDAIKDQATNKWVGPIPSGFGYHLVYITKKTAPQQPDFDTIKDDILRDLEYDNQKEVNELIYQELKKKYKIEIDVKSKDFDPKFIEHLQNEFDS